MGNFQDTIIVMLMFMSATSGKPCTKTVYGAVHKEQCGKDHVAIPRILEKSFVDGWDQSRSSLFKQETCMEEKKKKKKHCFVQEQPVGSES